MKLTLKRTDFTDNSTIGELFIDGAFFCYTIEDKVREVKIKGVTAIPTGTYKVIVNMSNRFKKLMPLLLDVPNFEGVRIHAGNTSADTEGCLILGYSKSANFVGNSKKAVADFMKKIEGQKDITITIL